MNEKDRPTYYAVIPSNVRYDKDLTANAKLLYGEITALGYANGYCYASDQYFAELYGVTVKCVQLWLKQLESKGFIEICQIKVENIFHRGIFFPKNVENNFRSNNTSTYNIKENIIKEKLTTSELINDKQTTSSLNSKKEINTVLTTDCKPKTVKRKKQTLVIPTFEEVQEFARARKRGDLAKTFYEYYTTTEWIKANGEPVVSWKGTFITWESRNPAPQKAENANPRSGKVVL